MTKLNPRQVKCLNLLWQEKDFRSAGYFAEKLQVSDKTVLQDMKVIQEYLNPFHVTLIRKTGSGIYLPDKARGNQDLINSLRTDLYELNEEDTMSIEARRREITKRMLLMDESGVSIQKLSEEFYVSRASIVNDLKYVERWGGTYGLVLTKKRSGRSLCGPESGIRHAIAAWIREYSPSKNTEITPGEYMTLREDSRFVHTGFFISEEVELSGKMMDYLETECGYTVSEPYYSYIRDHVLICIARTRRKYYIAADEERMPDAGTPQLAYAFGMLEVMRKCWDVPKQEAYYLYKYLISSDLYSGEPKDGLKGCEADDLDMALTISDFPPDSQTLG